MLIPRPFVAKSPWLRWQLHIPCHSRLPHRSRREAGSFEVLRDPQLPPSQALSLLEELFPDEIQKDGGQTPLVHDEVQSVPRLPLPDVNEGGGLESGRKSTPPQRLSELAAANALRCKQLAVLSLETASRSLIESDFRRIAPKGQHIDDWTGPGDILKSWSKE